MAQLKESNMLQKSLKRENFRKSVIAVVSAMAGKTNELIKLSNDISEEFNKRNLMFFYHQRTSDMRFTSWYR